MRATWVLGIFIMWAIPATAGYHLRDVAPLDLGNLEGQGQVADPRVSPATGTLGFEMLGSEGDTLEVYVAPLTFERGTPRLTEAASPVLHRRKDDPFSLGSVSQRAVSEHLTWGPPKRDRPRYAVAATRKAAPRGALQVNFDIHLTEPGRLRYLTDHPKNDAQPAFHPSGDLLAFTSGRSGQGDVYVYHFFAEGDPQVRITYEAAGSELYPTWSPDGKRLAYVGHLGREDHVYVVDDVTGILEAPAGTARQAAARRKSRDLTAGWRVSCLAPSFSPDGRWLAFYAREGTELRADLYVVPVRGGPPRRLLKGGLPETRRGPRWMPDSSGLIAVREDADRLNPLVYVPLAEGQPASVLTGGTELNADPFVVEVGGRTRLLFTAQGSKDHSEKRWRRIYVGRLEPLEQGRAR